MLRYTMLYWLLASPALAQNGGVLGLLRMSEDIEPAALRPMQRDGVQYVGRYAGTSGTFRYFGSDRIGSLLAPTFDYRFEAIGTVQRLQFTRGQAPVNGSVHYLLAATRSHFISDVMPDAVTQRELKSNLGGVGASVEYHPRNNPSTRRGAALSADVTWYGQAVGGSSTFGKLELAGLFHAQPHRRWSVGARFDVRSAWGEVPFYDTPYLAMRGLPPRQFANDVVVLTEVEAHSALARRWTLVTFGGVGRTARSWSDIRRNGVTTAGGGGFRYLVAAEAGMRSGIDIAVTPDGSLVFYLQSGAAWR